MTVNRHMIRCGVFVAIGLLGLLLYLTMDSAAATEGLTPAEQREVVRRLMEAGQLERAEQIARRMLIEQDSPASTACLLAQVLIARGQPAEAAALLEPIHQADRRADVAELLGRALLANGQTARGRRMLEDALSLEPDRLTAIAALSAALLEDHQVEDAARLLLPHGDEPAFRSQMVRLAVDRADAELLSRFLEPLDAATVGAVLAMHSGQDEWVTRLIRPDEPTPRAALVRAWLGRRHALAAERLINATLDHLDDPLDRARPPALTDDEPARLLAVAQSHWPGEPVWPQIAVESSEPTRSPQTDAQLIAQVADVRTPPRRWDAAVARLRDRLGARAAAAMIEACGRDDALAHAWRAELALAVGDAEAAARWIEAAQQQRPHSPRVLRILADLAPASAQLDHRWPGTFSP